MEAVKRNMFYNVKKILKFLFLTCLMLLVLTISLLYNSVSYLVDLRQNSINVKILEHTISIPTTLSSKDVARINFYPQTRYSSNQYLIADKGFLNNIFEISKNILLKTDPSQAIYQQSFTSEQRYIHFNPFRSSFQITQRGKTYRFETNIPDSSLEVWKDNEKLNQQTIKVPWIKLILFPILSSLSIAALFFILFTSISTLIKRFSSQNLNQKENFMENPKLANFLSIFILLSGVFLIGFIFIKVFHVMPGFGDEMNYLIQAKIFANGKIYAAEPSLSEFFKVNWMDIFGSDGKLWNFQPPGNSIILAIGWLVDVYWITVPIVGGIILTIQFFIAKALFNKNSFAFLHVLIIATSHYFLSLTSSFMAHAPSLLFISLFYLMIIKVIKNNNQKALIYAGIFLGIAFIIRPLNAVLSAFVPLIFLLVILIRQGLMQIRYISSSILLCCSIASLIFFYTYFITGNFTLPYLVKGPEVGQTLPVRLERPWKLPNLYRNVNEFQHRVDSFGYILNMSFFFIPLFVVLIDKKRLWIIAAYMSIAFYFVLHSFLHWYGWKWEPRMMYDISFIFFLLTSYGIWILYKKINQFSLTKYLGIALFILVLFYLIFIDLPNRFTTEYVNYNFSPFGVKETISKQKIVNAIIFFDDKGLFAPYSPQNEITFDGNIIYAINNGVNYNYKLITKFPKKDVYYAHDAQSLVRGTSFYKKDIYKIKDALKKYAHDNSIIIVVIPWRDIVQSSLDNILPGKKVSESEFLNLLKKSTTMNAMIVLVEDSTRLAPIIDSYFKNTTINLTKNYDSIIQVKKLGGSTQRFGNKLPGIKMTCYQGVSWDGTIKKEKITTTIDTSDCFGEYTSIRWQTIINMPESKNVIFDIGSDDGSAIILNGKTILDNNLYQTHGITQKTTSVTLKKGDNYLEIPYFNGPAEGFIHVGIIDPTGNEQPLSVTSFGSTLMVPN